MLNYGDITWAGHTREFYSADSKKKYQENLQRIPDWEYADVEISYTFNSLGYRAPEVNDIDWNNSIIAIGCSDMFGLGLREEHTIPSQIQMLTQTPTVNLGVCGSSNFLTASNLMRIKRAGYRPKGIAVLWTALARYSVFTSSETQHMGPWYEDDPVLHAWVEHEENLLEHFELVRELVRNLWDIPIAECSFFSGVEAIRIHQSDNSRDVFHGGVNTALDAAKLLVEQL